MARIAVFIDGSNMNSLVEKQNPGKRIDFRALMVLLKSWGELFAAYVYLPTPALGEEPGQQRHTEAVRKFLVFISHVGFRVRTKLTRPVFNGQEQVRTKANFDVEIAFDVAIAALSGKVDEIYLFSGDSDFEYILQRVRDLPQGIKTVVVSPYKGTANELKLVADRFIPLDSLLGQIIQDRPERTGRPHREIVEEAERALSPATPPEASPGADPLLESENPS